MSHFYRLLGKQITHFRLKAGLTQEELAEKTDYSVAFISLVERGINAPTVARLQDIAKTLGVEVWQLFYSDGNEETISPVKSSRRAIAPSSRRTHTTRRGRAAS